MIRGPVSLMWVAARRMVGRSRGDMVWTRLPSVVLLAVLAGCAGGPAQVGPTDTLAGAPTPGTQPGWWYVRFRLARPADNGVDSYLDALVADQVVSPALERYRTQIPLWRFHRRWPDDATGHQFSFIFYAPDAVAAPLILQIGGHPLLRQLHEQGYLVEYRVDRPDAGRATEPGGTSDPAWPPTVQREWPTFIMGASGMWLGLVQAEAARLAPLDLHPRYRAVETAVDALWYRQGNHAFLHHLNALFGYRPLRLIGGDSMRF